MLSAPARLRTGCARRAPAPGQHQHRNRRGLRDRALIGLLVFTFARIGATLGMTVADVNWQHRRLWVRLHEKGGKEHAMPCHHNLETYLQDYIEAAGLAGDREGTLFRTSYRRTGLLTERAMTQSDAWRMLQRRAQDAGI